MRRLGSGETDINTLPHYKQKSQNLSPGLSEPKDHESPRSATPPPHLKGSRTGSSAGRGGTRHAETHAEDGVRANPHFSVWHMGSRARGSFCAPERKPVEHARALQEGGASQASSENHRLITI